MAKPKPDNRTRVQKIKAAQHDALRAKLQGAKYLNQIEKNQKAYEELSKRLIGLRKQKLTTKDKEKRFEIMDTIEIINLELKVLKDWAETNFKLLRFVLPELRSIEVKDPDGNNPFTGFLGVLSEALQSDK